MDRAGADGRGHRAVNAFARVVFPTDKRPAIVAFQLALPLGIFSVHELVPLHHHLAPRFPVLFMRAGRRNVERLTRLELHTRRHQVQLLALAFLMKHPRDIVLVGLEACEGMALERVHELLTELRCHPLVLLGSERQNAVRVPVEPLLGVDEIPGRLRIAAQNDGRCLTAARLGEVRGEHTT